MILNLEINPAKVDVNVHPAKLEVRFQEENKIFQAIYHAIKDILLKSDLVKDTEKEIEESENRINRSAASFEERLRNLREAKKENNQGGLFGFRKQQEKQIEEYTEEESKIKTNNINEDFTPGKPINTSDILETLKSMKEKIETETQEVKKVEDVTENTNDNETSIEENNVKNTNEESKEAETDKENSDNYDVQDIPQTSTLKEETAEYDTKLSSDFDEMYTKTFGRMPISEKQEEKNNAIDIIKDNVSIFENDEKLKKPIYKFIGIIFKTYIILEIENEMYILDQHAAHERIMYEKVKKNYYSNEEKDSQLLLLPDVITLTHKEMDIAKENMSIFEKAGFSLEEFGENTIKLTGVPDVCIDLDTKELFLETLDEINTVARTAKQEKEEKFIATVACKSAVKANMALTREEVEQLMEQLLSLPNPFTCPHGRPTVIKMTKYDIERKFARK